MDLVNFHEAVAMPKLPIPSVSKKLETALMMILGVILLFSRDLRCEKISFNNRMIKMAVQHHRAVSSVCLLGA